MIARTRSSSLKNPRVLPAPTPRIGSFCTSRIRAALVWLSVLVGVAGADEGSRFHITPIDGNEKMGSLREVRDSGHTWIFEIDGQSVTLHATDLISLRRASEPPAPSKSSTPKSYFVFVGGDWLFADLETANESTCSVHSSILGELEIPLETVQAALLTQEQELTVRFAILKPLLNHQEPNDLVLLKSGDTFAGTFLELTAQVLRMKTAAGEVNLPRPTLRALRMNPSLAVEPRRQGLHAVVLLRDSSRLTLHSLGMQGHRVSFQTPFAAKGNLELSELEVLQFLGGNVTYLSDLEPLSYEHTPYLEISWPWTADRSVSGRPFSLRGQAALKGVGMHSRSRLRYDLSGRYRRFEATAGIDDETNGQGSVVFRVEVDGKERFASTVVRGTDPPLPIGPIDLAGAQQLTLIVEFADRGDVQDHADWSNARLLR